MAGYLRDYRQTTPQTEPIPGAVPNSAGGYSFPVNDWTQLDRFLILGSEGGTAYITEQKLTRENVQATLRCIKESGPAVVAKIERVSREGRAAKNDPALFALALCAREGDAETKRYAYQMLPHVARTGTHLLNFVAFYAALAPYGKNGQLGGNGFKRALQRWFRGDGYTAPKGDPGDWLALQALKYFSRNDWTLEDVIRLAHPKGEQRARLISKGAAYAQKWIASHSRDGVTDYGELAPHKPRLIEGAERIREAGVSPRTAAQLIREYSLPREAVPSTLLNDVQVWDALLDSMPIHALIRNLGKMSSIQFLRPLSDGTERVCRRLENDEQLKRARVHPLGVLNALKVYAQGHGEKGSLKWFAIPRIVDALDSAFYATFQYLEPTNKRLLLAPDISASMHSRKLPNSPLSVHEGAAVMAMAIARTEMQHMVVGVGTSAVEIPISPRQRLDDIVRILGGFRQGGTDLSLPMQFALDKGITVDAFIILTDSETWAGVAHPIEVMRTYRARHQSDAALITCQMVANMYSVGPATQDARCLDVSGFDASTPAVISGFLSPNVVPVTETPE